VKLTIEIDAPDHAVLMRELAWCFHNVARNHRHRYFGGSSAFSKWDMPLPDELAGTIREGKP
jgi:hypothetical protein